LTMACSQSPATERRQRPLDKQAASIPEMQELFYRLLRLLAKRTAEGGQEGTWAADVLEEAFEGGSDTQ
jgi:hypothetical protein